MADTDTEQTTPAPETDATPVNDTAVNDEPRNTDETDALGEGGLAALERERAAAREARKALKASEAQRAEYEARLKELEDRDLSEKEKLERERDELRQQLETEQQRARERAIRLHVAKAASTHRFRNVEDAAYFLRDGDIEFDDNGEPTNVDDLVKQIAADRPYLLDATPPKDIEPTPAPNDKGRDAASSAEKSRAYDRVFRRMNS